MPAIKRRFPGGLDIGTNSVKYLELGRDQEGSLRITNLVVEELPREAQENLRDRNRIVADMLKRLVETKGIEKRCFAAAPWASARLNLVRLPQMPLNEIDNAVRWEIRQMSQTDITDVALDYVVLEGQRSGFLGEQIGVLAIAAVKKDISEHAAVLEQAGISALAVDIEALADLAAFEYGKTSRASEVVLFLDFGAGKTALNIICNDELISTRYLNVTGNSLTKAIMEAAGVSWEDAEAMKKEFGLASEKAQVKDAIIPLLENMVQDIDHTFKYFSYQVTQSRVTRFDRIILSGGSSRLAALVPFLQERLNVDVQMVSSLSLLKPDDKYAGVNLDEVGPRLNVALGLALRGIE